jgi:hypothetical protein
MDDAIAHTTKPHALLEGKKTIIVVTSTIMVVVVLLFSFEFYKNIGQILVRCHRRRLFTINCKCTPPLLI